MKITKLEYQKKDPKRVNVFVDEKFAVGVSVDDVIKLGIFKGQEINQEVLNKIIGESDFGKLFNRALNFLSFRPRSEWEIRRKLHGEKPELVEIVMEKLKGIGQVNDEEFAKWFVDQRNTFRPKGKLAIKQELARVGVKVVPEMGATELELATRAMGKRKFSDPLKLQRFLLSRGFTWETIKSIIKNSDEDDE